MIPTIANDFDQDCREAVLRLRGSLLNLYQSVGADPNKPQEVSRRFKLGKNLTWKIARIIQAEDALAAVPLIPGAGGLTILLDAMEGAGADKDSVDRVQDALRSFDEMIEVHVGDRAMLELILDSMGSSEEKPLAMSRKLAFRGNSGVWGVQAEVRVTAHFMAPSARGDRLDLALVGGFTQVRRLRPIDRWPLFRVDSYHDDQTALGPEHGRIAIDPGAASDPWLIDSFCTGAVPEIHIQPTGTALVYEAGNGPVGRTGEFDCFFGFFDRAAVPRYRDAVDATGELVSSVSMPAKTLLFDLFVHRSLGEAMAPRVGLIGHPATGQMGAAGASALPHGERLTNLGPATMVKTPLVPNYDALAGMVFERAGWNPKDFVCLRLVMPYPPMPATVKLVYDLPTKP